MEKIQGVHSFLIRLLLVTCTTLAPVDLRAAEPPPAKSEATPSTPPATAANPSTPAAVAPAAATAPAPAADSEVLTLPKIEVTAKRVKELDKMIKKLDKAIVREKNKLKSTELDKVLNNPKLAEAGTLFGGNSSAYLESVAATRVRYMETERDLLSDMKVPRTLQDFQELEKELEQIRTMQRELDQATH